MVKGVYQDIPLGAQSAAEMSTLAFGRIAALALAGGPEGLKRAGHDLIEIGKGLLPLPILVTLSDITTSEHFRVDANAIFKSVKGALEADFNYKNVKRPEAGANLSEWKEHLGKANKDLVTKSSQIAALTCVLAPLGTTYTSSSLANTLKEDILRILYEQSYAKTVIETREQLTGNGEEIKNIQDIEELRKDVLFKKAKDRAEQLFNGRWGYSKMQLALAANIQGVEGLGDPPEIYFAIDHLGDPIAIPISHAIGIAVSEIYTEVLNQLWLYMADTGSEGSQFFSQFLENQLKVCEAVAETLSNKDEKDVAFKGGRNAAEQLIKVLKDKGKDPSGEMAKIVSNLPSARFQFDPAQYFREKKEILRGIAERKGQVNPEDFSDPETFAKSTTLKDLFDQVKKGDLKEAKKSMEAIGAWAQDKKAERVAELLQGMMEAEMENPSIGLQEPLKGEEREDEDGFDYENPQQTVQREYRNDYYENLAAAGLLAEAGMNPNRGDTRDADSAQRAIERESKREKRKQEKAQEERVAQIVEMGDQLMAEFLQLSPVQQKERLGEALQIMGIAEDKKEMDTTKLYDIIFKHTDKGTIDRALEKLIQIKGKEDVIPGLEDNIQSTRLKHKAHFLTHNAREVVWALLTQIPSVPAIARIVEEFAPKIAGVKENETPSPEQLKSIVATVLGLTAAMSAVADNVAAYMFARGVLIMFFEKTFGNGIWAKHKGLKRKISIIAKKVAEFAGSGTKFGNGPNFSQEKCEILEDDSNGQGIGINRIQLPVRETMPDQNLFATTAIASLVGGSILILYREIDNVAGTEKSKDQTQASNDDDNDDFPESMLSKKIDLKNPPSPSRRGIFSGEGWKDYLGGKQA
ncbi:MAG: hypothetical protein ACD_28C00016G0001 [uncultured bacterium]|nr:MAG: hypothetical protein ACD_28C00016G0001 [uncultured bacterium]